MTVRKLPDAYYGARARRVPNRPAPPATVNGHDVGREIETRARKEVAPYDAADLPPAPPRPISTDVFPYSAEIMPDAWEVPPSWLEFYYEDQVDAALEVVEHFKRGVKLVFLDAPTGAGKTAIADLVSRLLVLRAVYMCTTKSLQDQVEKDFEYARVLKGRANYPTLTKPFPEYTADDCQGSKACKWCPRPVFCPYRVAKREAAAAQLAVLNVAYFLREVNFVEHPAFARKDRLYVVDECDTMRDQLLSFVEFTLTKQRLADLGIEPPKKGSHKTTIAQWLKTEFFEAATLTAVDLKRGGVREQRAARRWLSLADDGLGVAAQLEDDNWIRDNDTAPLSMKPTLAAPFGPDKLWRHMTQDRSCVLMMSATIISAEEQVARLGWEGEYALVRTPMWFPAERRPIRVAPVVELKGGEKQGRADGTWNEMATVVRHVIERHPQDRILVHTVSYGFTNYLMRELSYVRKMRPVFTYSRADQRDEALAMYRDTERAVLLAPSLDRGIDLKGDDCRVIIIPKIPYPNLGDAQVSARMHQPGGSTSYAVDTIMTLVQMTGRGMRAADDYCETYILDKSFTRNLRKKNGQLFPSWWAEALDNRFRVKDLL